MKDRETIRKEVLDMSNANLLLMLPTGTGKTSIALDVAFNRVPICPKILIVVPKNSIKSSWEDEIERCGYEEDIDNITMTTYASVHKYIEQDWDFIMWDEAHHITDRVVNIIECSSNKACNILLSATIKRDILYRLKACFPELDIYRISMQSVIDSEVLPEPRIILLPLKLDNTTISECIIRNPSIKNKIVKLSWFGRRKAIGKKDAQYQIECTQAQYYQDLDTQVEWYKKKSTNPIMKNLWLHKAGERLKWLAYKKTPYVQELLKILKNQRVLTFCADIDQTEKLGSNAIHSKKKSSDITLKSFNEGKIKHITSVAMLDEGVNLTSCRVGIFANINSSERIVVQRIGRILRHKDPIIIIPYFINTREQEIVNNMLEGYNSDLIETMNIKDFKL